MLLLQAAMKMVWRNRREQEKAVSQTTMLVGARGTRTARLSQTKEMALLARNWVAEWCEDLTKNECVGG